MALKPVPRAARRSWRKKVRYPRGNRIRSIRGASSLIPALTPRYAAMPLALNTKLIYSTGTTYLNGAISSLTDVTFAFRGNGPYDPDAQIGGNQPAGFDNYMALYRFYRVTAARIDVEFSLGNNMTAVLYVSTATGAPGPSLSAACAQPGAQIISTLTQGGNANCLRRSLYCKTSDIVGTTITNDDLVGTSGSVPNDQWYFQWHMYNADGSTAQGYSCHFKITYYVQLFEPLAQTLS